MNTKRYSLSDQHHFFALLNRYRAAKKALIQGDGNAKTEFIRLSLAIHAAKASVPKRLWPLVNRD